MNRDSIFSLLFVCIIALAASPAMVMGYDSDGDMDCQFDHQQLPSSWDMGIHTASMDGDLIMGAGQEHSFDLGGLHVQDPVLATGAGHTSVAWPEHGSNQTAYETGGEIEDDKVAHESQADYDQKMIERLKDGQLSRFKKWLISDRGYSQDDTQVAFDAILRFYEKNPQRIDFVFEDVAEGLVEYVRELVKNGFSVSRTIFEDYINFYWESVCGYDPADDYCDKGTFLVALRCIDPMQEMQTEGYRLRKCTVHFKADNSTCSNEKRAHLSKSKGKRTYLSKSKGKSIIKSKQEDDAAMEQFILKRIDQPAQLTVKNYMGRMRFILKAIYNEGVYRVDSSSIVHCLERHVENLRSQNNSSADRRIRDVRMFVDFCNEYCQWNIPYSPCIARKNKVGTKKKRVGTKRKRKDTEL